MLPLSLFADVPGLLTPAALQSSPKLGAVPTEMVQGKSLHQDAQLDLGRVRSIAVEHAVLETFTSPRSATVDVFGVWGSSHRVWGSLVPHKGQLAAPQALH